MTEELKVKIKVDTSELKRSVADAKRSVSSLGEGNGKLSKQADGFNNSMIEVKGTLESIKHLDIAGLLGRAFEKASIHVQALKEQIKNAKDQFSLGRQFIFGGKDIKKEGLDKSLASSFASVKEGLFYMKDAFNQLGGVMSSVLKSAVVALGEILLIITAIVKVIKNGISVAKQMAKITFKAHKIGMNTNTYQKWGFVMQQVGGDVQDLTDFIKSLSSEQVKAREGNQDTIASFEKLGISASELATLNQNQLFERTVEGLAKIQDQTEKTALAYKIFGEEDASKIANLLSLSSQQLEALEANYQRLGGYASPQLVESSVQLHQALNNLKVAWQGVRNVIAETVLPTIINVVNWFTKAIAVIRMFLATIFNVDIETEKTFDGASKGADKLTSSIGAAGGAAAKLRKTLLGFDELNVLHDNSGGGGGISGITGGGNVGGLGTEDLFPEIPELEGLDKIRDWFDNNKNLIEDITTWTLTIGGLLVAVFNFLNGNIVLGIAGLAALGLGVAVGMGDEGTWERTAEWFKGTFKSIEMWVVRTWDRISQWFAENVAPIFTAEFWQEKWSQIKQGFNYGWQNVKTLLDEKFNGAGTWIETNIFPIFTADFWKQKWENIKLGFKHGWENIKKWFVKVTNDSNKWFEEHIFKYFTKEYWSRLWMSLKTTVKHWFEEAKKTVGKKWESIKTWFKTNVFPYFTSEFWEEKFNSIKEGGRAAINGLISIVEKAINRIVKNLNKISFTVPSWVPGVGGNNFGINLSEVHIPRLATGGITTRSTIANIGENGREAILPLDHNTQWMDKLAEKILSANAQPAKVVLTVDGKELGWATINNINAITKQTGGIPLTL